MWLKRGDRGKPVKAAGVQRRTTKKHGIGEHQRGKVHWESDEKRILVSTLNKTLVCKAENVCETVG